MIKLLDILNLKEGVTLNPDNSLDINIIASSDDFENDPFLINRDKKRIEKNGISVFYGISPNANFTFPDGRKMTSEEIDEIYNNTKDNNIDYDKLYKLVLVTFPDVGPISYILPLSSSAKLNKTLVEIFKKKYHTKDENILDKISKIKYRIPDMVNKEKYNAADPTTKKMVDTWIRRLLDLYGPDAKIPIKKSPNKQTGHPGLQSGARRLLNPTYQISKITPGSKIIVIDDILIGGTSIGEVFDNLIEMGIPKTSIVGYCFGIKEATNKPKNNQKDAISLYSPPSEDEKKKDNILDKTQQELSDLNFQLQDIEDKLKIKPQSKFLQDKRKELLNIISRRQQDYFRIRK